MAEYIDWLIETAKSFPFTWQNVLLGAGLFLVTFAGSIAVVSFLLVKVPPTYFLASHSRDFWLHRHPLIRWSGLIAKNVVGLLIVVLGILMSLPGVPGQGILTILLGVMLLDFPGKRRLELKLVTRPKVLQTINRLRAKFDKPPLQFDRTDER
ncbi:MAG TPA: hypothetical protein VF666_17005 [Pyrinomonadaceae bacterium]